MRAVIVAASLIVLVAGCSKKGPECESIVKIVNPTADKLTRAGAINAEKAEEHIAAMNEVARISADAADALGKLPLTVPELQQASVAYQAMAREAASAAREVGEAVKSAEVGVTAAEEGAKRLESVAETFAKDCAAPENAPGAPSCKAFGEAMTRFPEDAGKREEAAKVVAELEKVAFNSKALADDARQVIALLKANDKVLADLKATEAKAVAAEKKFEGAAEKEGPIVEGLNKICAP